MSEEDREKDYDDILDDGLDAIRKLYEDRTTMGLFGKSWYVRKQNGDSYKVTTYNNRCDCPSGRDCKHLKAARLLEVIVLDRLAP